MSSEFDRLRQRVLEALRDLDLYERGRSEEARRQRDDQLREMDPADMTPAERSRWMWLINRRTLLIALALLTGAATAIEWARSHSRQLVASAALTAAVVWSSQISPESVEDPDGDIAADPPQTVLLLPGELGKAAPTPTVTPTTTPSPTVTLEDRTPPVANEGEPEPPTPDPTDSPEPTTTVTSTPPPSPSPTRPRPTPPPPPPTPRPSPTTPPPPSPSPTPSPTKTPPPPDDEIGRAHV